ncbi:hypothetical protein ACFWE3_24525 [Mycobacteriaceae bacterium NPDC060252]
MSLPAGVFGRWISLPDRDIVQVGVGVVGRERTIAHELGHMVLGHRGRPVAQYAAGLMQAASHELLAHMLQRTCGDDESDTPGCDYDDELAAERFAGLLMRRIKAGQWGQQSWAHDLDTALG